jgi:spore germination protein YaaH
MRTASRFQPGKALVALALLVSLVALPDGSSPFRAERADAATPLRFVSGWIPLWSTAGLAPLTSNQGNDLVMSDTSVFNFSVTGATTFTPPTPSYSNNLVTAARALRARGLPVIPSLTDGMSGAKEEGLAIMLRDQMDVHVQAIVDRVMLGVDGIAFDGIDLDYEGFAFDDSASSWVRTKPIWTDFVTRLGAALDAQGKVLSVTVPVGVSPSTGYSVYNWAGIIPAVDRLRLMTYDYSWSVAGPVSPGNWVQTTITYVKGLVVAAGRDPKMVQIGVPTYGRNWATAESGTCPASVLQRSDPSMRAAESLAASKGITPTRHSSGEMTFSYTEQFTSDGMRLNATGASATTAETAVIQDGRPTPVVAATSVLPTAAAPAASVAAAVTPVEPTGLAKAKRLSMCTVRRTVYYADETTVVQRAQMSLDAGLGGIAIWAFGYETTDLWPMLRAVGDQYGTP